MTLTERRGRTSSFRQIRSFVPDADETDEGNAQTPTMQTTLIRNDNVSADHGDITVWVAKLLLFASSDEALDHTRNANDHEEQC